MSNLKNYSPEVEPMVTVGLAVFNGGKFLEYAVLSILNQSWAHWELLLLDDGSTDKAIDRLSILADPRIIVIRDGQNRGHSYRLNQAVGMAKGKYFARMDQDDICHPKRLELQATFLELQPEIDLLATRCLKIDQKEKIIGTLPSAIRHADICRQPWRGIYMAHPSWMGRTEWFRRNAYQDPAPYCCEDQELLLRAHYSSNYHTLPTQLLAYRIHANPPWRKQFRTRLATKRMKVRHFLNRKELLFASLSWIIGHAMVGYDLLNKILCRLSLPAIVRQGDKLPTEVRREWEELIKAIKVSAKRSINS